MDQTARGPDTLAGQQVEAPKGVAAPAQQSTAIHLMWRRGILPAPVIAWLKGFLERQNLEAPSLWPYQAYADLDEQQASQISCFG